MIHKSISVTTYTVVFILLMLLLVATVGAAFFHFGRFNLIVAMLIATVKAALIGIYFMHLRFTMPLIRLVAVGAVLWLFIGAVLTASDYLTRGWNEPQEYRNPVSTIPSEVDRVEFDADRDRHRTDPQQQSQPVPQNDGERGM